MQFSRLYFLSSTSLHKDNRIENREENTSRLNGVAKLVRSSSAQRAPSEVAKCVFSAGNRGKYNGQKSEAAWMSSAGDHDG
ncbi:hypothetical protein ACTXT7_015694 [Hymenolepis weldensis]